MTEVLVETYKLSKMYGSIKAIEDLTFEMKKGEILGFLGPNGAGKTTTMKILTCFISPTSGTAKVKGFDVLDSPLEVRKHVGYLPENNPLYPEMTVSEYLQFIGKLRGIESKKLKGVMVEAIEKCGLTEMVGREIRTLSKGYRQRVGLAQTLLHDPEILILDEPTSGLDPNQIVEIRNLIKELGKEKTIILSTHNLAEVQASCGRVIIIDKGKLIADGSPEELSERREGRRYELIIEKDNIDGEGAAKVIKERINGIKQVELSGESKEEIKFTIIGERGKDLRKEIWKFVVEQGWSLLELRREAVSLESIFQELTKSEEPQN